MTAGVLRDPRGGRLPAPKPQLSCATSSRRGPMAAARTPPPLPSLPDAGEAPTPTWEPFPDASFGASAAGIAGRPLEGADLETAVMKEADAAADAAEDAVASAARAAAAAAAAPDDPEAVAAANAAAAAAAASQLAAGQLAYLLNVTRRDADLRQDEVSRLRKLAKRTRLNADDARTVSELREQLVSTQAELDAFKQRIVKHKEQFQQHVLVLREKTAKRLREIETLKARVAELETAQKTAHEEKLRIQDGAARALQAKDEEIEVSELCAACAERSR